MNLLSQDEILETLSWFHSTKKDAYSIRRLGIFGSAARNQLQPESDVDVVVELAEADLLALVGIKQELEALFGHSVDLVRYREQMNEFLKQRIDQEAIYV